MPSKLARFVLHVLVGLTAASIMLAPAIWPDPSSTTEIFFDP
ncbi:hypothetical protein [Sphingosinicella sp. BN140058]|nr:hypothetical protein [Sphingosinicella sp. BN140058]